MVRTLTFITFLISSIINGQQIINPSGGGGGGGSGTGSTCTSVNIAAAAITDATASHTITTSIVIPANNIITFVRSKEKVIFASSGATVTSMYLSVGDIAGTATEYMAVSTMFTLVSDTNKTDIAPMYSTTAASHTIGVKFTGSAALSGVDSGSVDITVCYQAIK